MTEEEQRKKRIQEAYDKAYEKEAIIQAENRAKLDAQAKANQKPFYKKVLGAMEGIGKDLNRGIQSYEMPEFDPLTGVRLRPPKKENK